MSYYFEVLKKYAVFSGRATRKEYWMFCLFNIIILIALSLVGSALLLVGSRVVFSIYNFYSMAILIPSIAVCFRRMHDVNKSGWYIIIPIYNLILACTNGTKGNNKYGHDPKEVKSITKTDPALP